MKTSGLDDNRVELMMRMPRKPRYETRLGWMRKIDEALEMGTG